MLVFALVHLHRCPVGAALVVLGIAFFATIPVFEHYEIAARERDPTTLRANNAMWLALEEGAELLGMTAFLAGALRFLRAFLAAGDAAPVIRLALRQSAAMRALVGLGVLGALGILAALRWDPAVTLTGGNGKVANWFASAPLLAASVALAAVAGRGRGALLSLAGAGLVASAFVGADLRVYFWGCRSGLAAHRACDCADGCRRAGRGDRSGACDAGWRHTRGRACSADCRGCAGCGGVVALPRRGAGDRLGGHHRCPRATTGAAAGGLSRNGRDRVTPRGAAHARSGGRLPKCRAQRSAR